jgi:hypothetical protein
MVNPIHLRNDDYVNYVANGNRYSAGMILYRDGSGLAWNQGSGYIFDLFGSNCALAISSGGLISGAQTNCL